ncbi:MAG TPA: hypothetical protein ACFCUY_14335 [Xenococcaceae cyanobacterium]
MYFLAISDQINQATSSRTWQIYSFSSELPFRLFSTSRLKEKFAGTRLCSVLRKMRSR